MATRFVRVDLSETARDYRPIAVEPGVPMLDRSGANARIMFRWLGGMVAEPVWEGDAVGFYVRDDQGGRLEDVICQPASSQDIATILKDDMAKLRQRLEQSKAETSTERTLRKVLMRTFGELADNPNRNDLDSYFFRYRDVIGNWRLIWCWGYQRQDGEPAPSVVCTNPDCNLLFLRRPGKSPRCPACAGELSIRNAKKTNWKVAALAGLALLLLLLGVGWWATRPARLVASPNTFTGPIGSSIESKVVEKGLFRSHDVTREAIGISDDPRVARFDPITGEIHLLGAGATKIEFYRGGMKADVAVAVSADPNPDKLVIEPKSVDIAVGSTARLHCFGEYKNGTRADLTGAVVWVPQNDGKAFAAGGLVEGLVPGATTVTARFRASPQSPNVEATAAVNVSKVDFKTLEVAVDPKTIAVGRGGKLRIDGVAADGKHYSLLESSQLKTSVSPAYLAAVTGPDVRGKRAGDGKLSASLAGSALTGSGDLKVVLPSSFTAQVRPAALDLAVHEIADIGYISPDMGPVNLSSSKPGIVEITAANRVIGRAVGDTEIDVQQGGRSIGKVAITVTQAEFQSLAFDPGYLAVPVDGSIRPRVTAEIKGSQPPRMAEISPDRLMTHTDKLNPQYAQFNDRTFELRGISPTDDPSKPQMLTANLAAFHAEAPVDVYVAPCRLELEPAGPVDLPMGQMMRLQGFATYSGGRRVQVRPERMAWASEEAKTGKKVEGLELYYHDREFPDLAGAVGATKSGAGPLTVYATYHKTESNRVVFKSVDADPTVKLAIEVDRTLRIAGERGLAVLTATNATGDVELVPSLTKFTSSNDKVLKIIREKMGQFATGVVGDANVTASHAAAKEPATLKFHVGDPGKMRLVFDPATLQVPVNQQAALNLYLENTEAGKTDRVPIEAASIGFYVAQPEAVRFTPPVVTGLVPTKPFDITASIPVLSRPATAKVEVVAAETKGLRIMPSAQPPLAPGQSISLLVEQQVADNGPWQEVRPDAVSWNVQGDPIWTPPSESLRPSVALSPDSKAAVTVQATVAGKSATLVLSSKDSGPDAKTARLVLDREPAGKYLAVGHSQRYAVLVEKDGKTEPAADVHWPENFENDYVKWDAPVLTAKQADYTQFLRADVGGRNVLWHITTYMVNTTSGTGETPPGVKPEIPDSLKIVSDQGPLVRFPAGATFDDFRVEAHYADGYTRLVTKKARLTTPEPPASACLSAAGGKLIGVRTGSTEVSAEFENIKTTIPLKAEVLGEVDIDKLVIDPSPMVARPGETYELKAIGYKNGKSIGDITALGGLTWKSSKPEVARMTGPSLSAVGLGAADVTVERGAIKGSTPVNVTNTIDGDLRVDPKTIVMHVGESLRMGSDVNVYRGEMNVSENCEVVPESPGVVVYVPETKSLVAKNEGRVPLGIAVGDKVTRIEVEVRPQSVEFEGTLSIEPASMILAPGQAERVRVFLDTKDGQHIDRTSSAVIKAIPSDVATIDDKLSRVCAVKPGKAQIVAAVGNLVSGKASLEVVDEDITEILADPADVQMPVGGDGPVSIFGRAKTPGLKELFPQEGLKVVPNKSGVVELLGTEVVRGKAEGEDALAVSLNDKLKTQVAVKVLANAVGNLQIDPVVKTITTNEGITYEVTGIRGGQRVILTAQDGVQLKIADNNVAEVADGLTVTAKAPGTTKVIATFGGERAEATLNVVPGGAIQGLPGVGVLRGGERIVTDGGRDVIVGGVDPLEIKPAGNPVGLVFRPDVYMAGVQALPETAKVLEQYENGGFKDVTNDPNLQLTVPNEKIAKMEKDKTDAGLKISPVGPGLTTLSGSYNGQVAKMRIEINGGDTIGGLTGTLVGLPQSLRLASGEAQALPPAEIDPGPGQAHIPVEVKVVAAEGQGIVSVGDKNVIMGKSPGQSRVMVVPVDPRYAAMSTPIEVDVTPAEKLSMDPTEATLQVGQTVAPSVKSRAENGEETAVAGAKIESSDRGVVDVDPDNPTQFKAVGQGQAELIATYHGIELKAKVSVSSDRFKSVVPQLNDIAGNKDQFDLTIEALAAKDEGELEYRVYSADDAAPKENWVPNQDSPDGRKVTLRSDPINYGSRDATYHLVLEARDKVKKTVQKYPLPFTIAGVVQVGKGGDKAPAAGAGGTKLQGAPPEMKGASAENK
jgi:hypothetical protein